MENFKLFHNNELNIKHYCCHSNCKCNYFENCTVVNCGFYYHGHLLLVTLMSSFPYKVIGCTDEMIVPRELTRNIKTTHICYDSN